MLILKNILLRYIMKRHEGDFIIIKDSVYQKNTTVINVYVPTAELQNTQSKTKRKNTHQ